MQVKETVLGHLKKLTRLEKLKQKTFRETFADLPPGTERLKLIKFIEKFKPINWVENPEWIELVWKTIKKHCNISSLTKINRNKERE